MTLFSCILARDLKIALRSGGGWFYALFFFAVFTALAGIAFGPSMSALASAAPAAVWLAAALAIQFAATGLFEADIHDGTLRALASEQESLAPYWGAKFALLALTAALPLVISAPFFLTMLGVPFAKGLGVMALLAIGAPSLIAVALLTSALAAGLRAGGLLAMIVAAPFIAPALIFGVGAAKAFLAGGGLGSPETLILGALSLFMTAATPAFAIAALRLSLE